LKDLADIRHQPGNPQQRAHVGERRRLLRLQWQGIAIDQAWMFEQHLLRPGALHEAVFRGRCGGQ
jgi:hypothetical protein